MVLRPISSSSFLNFDLFVCNLFRNFCGFFCAELHWPWRCNLAHYLYSLCLLPIFERHHQNEVRIFGCAIISVIEYWPAGCTNIECRWQAWINCPRPMYVCETDFQRHRLFSGPGIVSLLSSGQSKWMTQLVNRFRFNLSSEKLLLSLMIYLKIVMKLRVKLFPFPSYKPVQLSFYFWKGRLLTSTIKIDDVFLLLST